MTSFSELWNKFEESDDDSTKRGLCVLMVDITQDDALKKKVKLEYEVFDFYLNNLGLIESLEADMQRFRRGTDEFFARHNRADNFDYYCSRFNETHNL